MLVNVRLMGVMGENFGYHHQYEVSNARDIFKALAANFANFRQFICGSEDAGIAYQVLLDGVESDKDNLCKAKAPIFMVITPVVVGAGWVGKVLAGIAILAVAAFVPFSIGLLGAGVISGASIGAALLLSGISQALAEGDKKTSSRDQSTAIGQTATTIQGSPIAVCYGRVFVTGKIISAGSTVSRR